MFMIKVVWDWPSSKIDLKSHFTMLRTVYKVKRAFSLTWLRKGPKETVNRPARSREVYSCTNLTTVKVTPMLPLLPLRSTALTTGQRFTFGSDVVQIGEPGRTQWLPGDRSGIPGRDLPGGYSRELQGAWSTLSSGFVELDIEKTLITSKVKLRIVLPGWWIYLIFLTWKIRLAIYAPQF